MLDYLEYLEDTKYLLLPQQEFLISRYLLPN
jgi:hypothetical protein